MSESEATFTIEGDKPAYPSSWRAVGPGEKAVSHPDDDNYCEECDALFDGRTCPGCPTPEQRIASGDFYGLACAVLKEHEHGGYATKASYLGEAMKLCFDKGAAQSSSQEKP